MSENERLLTDIVKESWAKSANDKTTFESLMAIANLAFEAGRKAQKKDDAVIWKEQQQRIAELKSDYYALYQERIGEFWMWQGDGEDHLESTTCPILIKAQDLRDLLKEQAEKDRAEVKSLKKTWSELQNRIDFYQKELDKDNQALAEAEKRGAREFTSWFGSLLDSCLSYVPDAGDRGKIIEVWQAKLKSLEER